MLNEVLPVPEGRDGQWLELANRGEQPVDLNGVAFTNSLTETYRLPDGLAPLGPDELVVVRFDGQNRSEERTVHADRLGFLVNASDVVSMTDAAGHVLDSVAWGDRESAVPLGNGAIVPSLPPIGSSIGRVPSNGPAATGSFAARRQAWTTFAADQVTPLGPNPVPRPEAFPGVGELVVPPGAVELAWYSVPGAPGYRLEFAQDEAFSTLIDEATVATSEYTTPALAVGEYYWRVQALAGSEGGGSAEAGPYSAVRPLHVRAGWGPGLATHQSGWHTQPVQQLGPRKDTGMLLLESDKEHGAHAWNAPHAEFDSSDPADSHNGALALVAMVNHLYRGNATQDRLGYFLRKDRKRGPEEDLNYGTGLTVEELQKVLVFSVGEVSVDTYPPNLGTLREGLWRRIKQELDLGTFVLCEISGCVVVSGYYEGAQASSDRSLRYHEPLAPGPIDIPWDMLSPTLIMWTRFSPSGLRLDEEAVSTDSDGDGIVDFDETERFGTLPSDSDSDRDDLPDFQDVRMSMFDLKRGHAYGGAARSRVFDRDRLPPERDRDSDDGKCMDGLEDTNKDGELQFGAGESSPLDLKDDGCLLVITKDHFDVVLQLDGGGTLHTKWDWNTYLTLKPSLNEARKLEGHGDFRYRQSGITTFVDDPCPVGIWPETGPDWGGDVTGSIIPEGTFIDGGVVSPPYTITYTQCGSSSSSTSTITSGATFLPPLVNGVYDSRRDEPLGPNATGEFYFTIHAEQVEPEP